jgi:hypothetical protein
VRDSVMGRSLEKIVAPVYHIDGSSPH